MTHNVRHSLVRDYRVMYWNRYRSTAAAISDAEIIQFYLDNLCAITKTVQDEEVLADMRDAAIYYARQLQAA